jgi:hypothetical protein
VSSSNQSFSQEGGGAHHHHHLDAPNKTTTIPTSLPSPLSLSIIIIIMETKPKQNRIHTFG